MFVIIDDVQTGERLMERELGEETILDEEIFAREIADRYGVDLDDPEEGILSCFGDIRVEFRSDPNNAVCIYSGRSFYFKHDE